MTIKKVLFSLALFLAFAAVGNAAILEPIHDVKSPKAFSHSAEKDADESQCCFICHPSHHQWLVPNWFGSKASLIASESFVNPNVTPHSDPPIGSIFHPPLAF